MQTIQTGQGRITLLAMIRALVGAIALGALVVVALNLTGSGPTNRSADIPDDTVVAHLSNGPMPGAASLAPLLAATRANPTDLTAAQSAAAALIASGRRAGNSRLVGAALGILRPFLTDAAPPETLRLAAEARQYQHDFNGALTLLDRAIAADPQATDARLMRATIHLVQGDLTEAERDCAVIHAQRPDVGLMCQSTALTLTDSAPKVATRLQALLQTNMLDPGLHGWAQSLLGEIARLQDQPDKAVSYLTEVVTADPYALRERLMLADLLLAQGKPGEVLSLLQDAPPVDGVLIRRALAARGTGDRAAATLTETDLAARVKLNLQLGLNAHSREDAMYFLLLANDPVQALERAKVNWALQHEFEDASLLLAAADVAGQPAEALPVLQWMTENNITAPALTIPASVARLAP
ncbi:MAG: tetratricopeptide repeat protein [bacterium]